MSVITNERMKSSEKQFVCQRIAFCGSMGSGKSWAAKYLKDFFLSQDCPSRIMSLSTAIKNLVLGNTQFENRDGYQTIGTMGRTIDPESWVNILLKEIKREEAGTNIIVDDVRYENELIALRNLGFKIIYMDTPWNVRLLRIHKRYMNDKGPGSVDFTDFVRWFTHDSEIQLDDLPETIFDKVIKTSKELGKYFNEEWNMDL